MVKFAVNCRMSSRKTSGLSSCPLMGSSLPSVKQAKRLRELDQGGLPNGDVIDGVLREEKRRLTT